MPPSPSSDAENTLNGVLAQVGAAEGGVAERFEPDAATREAVAQHAAFRAWASAKLTELAATRDLHGMARLLDLVLGVAVPPTPSTSDVPQNPEGPSDDGLVGLFFSLLESALAMLPLTLCREFWPYLEARHMLISDTAQGPNSIVLLRTCRSLLARLHPELESVEAGQVLVLLASVKGFAHASRLNKRGKVSHRGYYDDDPASAWPTNDAKASPFDASVQLRDLSSLNTSALKSFLQFLHERISGKRASRIPSSAAIDLYGLEWRNSPPFPELHLLCDEIRIALLKLESEDVAAQDAELKALVQSLQDEVDRIKRASKPLYDRVLVSERAWRKWKTAQCRYIDVADAVLPTLSSDAHASFLFTEPATNLENLELDMGNSRLTALLNAESTAASFAVPLQWTRAAESYKEQSQNTKLGRQSQETLQFRARRCEPWAVLLAHQAQIPENTHPELKALEERAEEPSESLKRPSGAASEAGADDPAPKRARLSYEEDSRYQDRQRGLQSTARPLPY